MGTFGELLGQIGKAYVDGYKRDLEEIERAYENGQDLDDYTLVKKWKNTSGKARIGYAKALADRDLLYKDDDGNYHQTYELREMLKYM